METDKTPGQFAHLLPPRKPTLAEAVRNAIAASDELSRGLVAASDAEFTRLDSADFDARAALKQALADAGISSRDIKRLAEVL